MKPTKTTSRGAAPDLARAANSRWAFCFQVVPLYAEVAWQPSAPGQTPANRQDIEVLYVGLPEPINLEMDPATRTLYWTDRGDPPRGNTVSRAPLDAPAGKRPAPEMLFSHRMEGIGLALDPKGGRMFITDFAGSVYSANLDGSNQRTLLFAQGNLAGIAYVELT